MKTRWKIFVALGLAGVGFVAWAQADLLEWDLKNHVPTVSINESKNYRIYSGKLEVEPKELDLGGSRYRVGDVWLEHRSETRRVSLLFTHQEILPDLVLCVKITPLDIENVVMIKDAKLEHVLYSSVSGVLFTEVGVIRPTSFVLCTRNQRSEVRIQIKTDPNQAPEPTRGTGAVLFIQSRWPRVSQL